MALDTDALKSEMLQKAKATAIHIEELFPRKLGKFTLTLCRVVDFRDPGARIRWGVSLDDIRSPERKKCQEVGEKVRSAGYEGIIYPAATGTGSNIAVFMDRLKPNSRVSVAEEKIAESIGKIG